MVRGAQHGAAAQLLNDVQRSDRQQGAAVFPVLPRAEGRGRRSDHAARQSLRFTRLQANAQLPGRERRWKNKRYGHAKLKAFHLGSQTAVCLSRFSVWEPREPQARVKIGLKEPKGGFVSGPLGQHVKARAGCALGPLAAVLLRRRLRVWAGVTYASSARPQRTQHLTLKHFHWLCFCCRTAK